MPVPHLLLVDDDRLALATFAEGLKSLGYTVAKADTAEAALTLAAADDFDLAILDIRMTGINGIELAHLLNRRHRLPSMFLSAYGERVEVVEAIREGGLGYLVKPIDAAHAMPAIEAAIARARDIKTLLQTKVQLEQALSGSRKTSIAIGIVMAQEGYSEELAFARLREEARRQRSKLETYCGELVAALERRTRL